MAMQLTVFCRFEYGLCEVHGAGAGDGSVFFPRAGETVVSVGFEAGADGGGALMKRVPGCQESRTRRVTVVDGGGRGRQDVSLCNVISGGLDVVYLPAAGVVVVGRVGMSLWVMVGLAVLAVWMAVILAHNLEYVLKGTQVAGSLSTTELTLVLVVLLCAFGEVSCFAS